MSRKDDIKSLISKLNRRLQKLEEQKALYGLSTDPGVLIEIEDIKAEIEKLQVELEVSEDSEPSAYTMIFEQMDSTKNCPYCYEIIKSQAIICKHCHMDLTGSGASTAQGKTIGAAGGITIGRIQDTKGDIYIINTLGDLEGIDEAHRHKLRSIYKNQIRNHPEKAEYHFALGLNYLDLAMYNLAITSFQAALEKGLREANIFYYLALAHVGGRRPKILKLSAVKFIENCLNAAIQLDSTQAHYLYLWTLIKYDYYQANGLKLSPPTIEELLTIAQQRYFNRAEIKQLFKHVLVPDSPIKRKIMSRW
jgi:hypothetical protein